MIRLLLVRFFSSLHDFLHSPVKVLAICFALAFVNLVLDGSLFQLWGLHRDSYELRENMQRVKADSQKLAMKIKRASDPDFIELEARDRFDLASEGDLIFVFSDEER